MKLLPFLLRHKVAIATISGGFTLLSAGGIWWFFFKKVPLPTECMLATAKRVPIRSLLNKPYKTFDDVQRSFRTLRSCLQRTKDPRTGFLRVYIIVTRVIVQWTLQHTPTHIPRSTKPQLVERLLLTFANQYREAFYHYLTKQHVNVSWSQFFDYLRAYKDKKFHPAVGLLLAMNAHINEDLPFALFALRKTLRELQSDYKTIDRIFIHYAKQITEEADTICREARRKLPRILFDHAIVAAGIIRFRRRSWELGMEYATATGPRRHRVKRKISRRAERYARRIRQVTGIRGLADMLGASQPTPIKRLSP